MSSLLTAAQPSVGGKITRSPLVTRRSRPPASTMVASEAMRWSSTPPAESPSPPGPPGTCRDNKITPFLTDGSFGVAAYILGEGGEEVEVTSGHEDPEIEAM